MTDLHCHILPGIDDGAKDVDMSMELLRLELESGVDTIVCTPHFNFEKQDLNSFLERRQNAAMRLAQACRAARMPLRLKLGAEVVFSPRLLEPEARALCIPGSGVMLVEFPMTYYPQWTTDVLYRMSLSGLTPIIAHAERYPYIAQDPNILSDLIEAGAWIQANAASLINHPHRSKLVQAMIRHDMVHILASDTHSPDKRPPLLGQAFDLVEKKCGAQAAQRLQHNAALLAEGETPPAPECGQLRKIFGQYR